MLRRLDKILLTEEERFPYSTTHYHCGCHIIEGTPNNVDLNKSIYCEDRVYGWRKSAHYTVPCLYLQGLKLRRIQASRRTVWTTEKF